MKLADLRKLSVRQNLKIRFRLGNGLECVVTEQGVAQVPGLKAAPDFNLEQELAAAAQFVLEPLDSGKKRPVQPRSVSREELAALTAAGSGASRQDEEE